MKIFLICTALAVPSLTSAQTNPPPNKFYNYAALTIKAGHLKVPALYVTAEQRAKFERLISLKRSFLPKLKATAQSHALR